MEQTLFILIAFVVFAGLFVRFGLGTVIGLLLAGVIIGPSGLELVHDLDSVATLAELGVVFLLFNVGLEIRLERLRVFGWRVYMLAVTQVVVTAAAIAAIAHGFGLGWEAAALVGGALALSSTALVLQVLSDLGRTLTQLGRLALATLIVQDIAVGPLLVAATVLGNGGGQSPPLAQLLLGGLAAIVVVVAVARLALPAILHQVASLRAPELFAAVTLLVVLSASYATERAGLSAALGAFFAGVMVADTPFRHQIAADIAPFRGLFLGLFFMTVGMRIDLGLTLEQPAVLAALTVGLILLKGSLLFLIAVALRFPRRLAVQLAVLLGQGSEFSFVILALAAGGGLLMAAEANLLIVAVALSMLVAPVAAAAARNRLDREEGEAASRLARIDAGSVELADHVVVVGFGQVGMALTRHLIGLGISVMVLDNDSQRVRAARGRDLPVFFGNATRSDVLRAAHISRAALVVVALSGPGVSVRVADLVRRLAPAVRVIARAHDADDVPALQAVGVRAVVLDGLTTAVELAERAVLLLDREPEGDAVAEG